MLLLFDQIAEATRYS